MNFSENLKRIRKENNLSQEQLAEKLGVSRQSVSKWESGLAYPEMDKVIQLCNLFNLNIDELLNQDIKEVEKSKQSKLKVNKYIDDFLSFVTKTINMFSSMKFKQVIKCLFEQFLIILILIILTSIAGNILSSIFRGLFNFLPDSIYFYLYRVFDAMYHLITTILIIVIVLHIFKTRYLDYYVVVDNEEKEDETKNEDNKSKEEKYISKGKERVIIRDPKHSEYRFISGLLKCILFFIKCITILISIPFCVSLISFVIVLVVSFLFVKSGILFIGVFLGLLAAIIINLVILDLMFNFIFNRKNKFGVLGILFASSLIIIGISIGLCAISIKDLKIIREYDSNYIIRSEEIIELTEDTFIPHKDIEYIETDSNEVKVVYEHANYCSIESDYISKYKYIYTNCGGNDSDSIKNIIKDINNKVFISPDYLKVYVYTSKNNIAKIKYNEENYYDKENN